MMNPTHEIGNDQRQMWNGASGHAWVDAQDVLDRVLEPFEGPLLDAVRLLAPSRVLDVGCGTGGTTVAAARLLGSEGRCVGVDISEPMIAGARARAERTNLPVSFVCADAQSHTFDAAAFDLILSRFGVMFFDDPVRAFANVRRAATERGALRFVAWRSAAENPFMTTAERAAAPLLPNLAPRNLDGPGQFGLADGDRVAAILKESGWLDVTVREADIACTMPEHELIGYFTRLGPVGRILHEVDEETRARVVATVRAAFDPFVHGADVRFNGACWLVDAVAGHR